VNEPIRLMVDFDVVFDEHYAGLVRYVRRLTGDTDVAEDIAQEAMVRLYDRQVSGTEAGVRAWLYKTVTHLVRDRYRVDTNRQRLLEVHPVLPGATEAPDTALERREARAVAEGALDGLPDRDKEILLMRYSGFSYKEIASAVGVAATSIGTLLARAEQRFAEAVSAGEPA
jgi:RNA polymerase sigma factor (sigma-70 family)